MLERLIIFFLIALLPLFNRVAVVDLGRVSKDNLFAILSIALSAILEPKRRLPRWVHASALLLSIYPVMISKNPASIAGMMQSFYFFSGIFMLIRLIESFDLAMFEVVKLALIAGACIQSFLIVFEYLFFDLYAEFMYLFGAKGKFYATKYFAGSLMNSNLSGAYVALASLFVFERSKLLFGLCVGAMVLSGSLMGPLSIMPALVYMNTGLSKIKIILPVFIVFIVAPFVGVGGHDSLRFEIWKGILDQYDFGHFLFGGGFAWFYDLGLIFDGTWVAQEHNEYLALINTFGLIGVGLFVWFLYDFCTFNFKEKSVEAFILAFMFNSYGHFALHQSTVAVLFIFVLGFYYSQRLNNGMEWRVFNR